MANAAVLDAELIEEYLAAYKASNNQNLTLADVFALAYGLGYKQGTSTEYARCQGNVRQNIDQFSKQIIHTLGPKEAIRLFRQMVQLP